jgi:hypothetical protein
MGLFYFLFGIIAGIALIALSPVIIVMLGATLAIGFVVALPLIVAVMILCGLLALTPALAYGLAIAALIVALWASDRRRRLPPAATSGR